MGEGTEAGRGSSRKLIRLSHYDKMTRPLEVSPGIGQCSVSGIRIQRNLLRTEERNAKDY